MGGFDDGLRGTRAGTCCNVLLKGPPIILFEGLIADDSILDRFCAWTTVISDYDAKRSRVMLYRLLMRRAAAQALKALNLQIAQS